MSLDSTFWCPVPCRLDRVWFVWEPCVLKRRWEKTSRDTQWTDLVRHPEVARDWEDYDVAWLRCSLRFRWDE